MRGIIMEENHAAWVQFKMVFPAINWHFRHYVTLGTKTPPCCLETMSLEIGKWLVGATSIISLIYRSCLGTM